jgi:hypothetical protein
MSGAAKVFKNLFRSPERPEAPKAPEPVESIEPAEEQKTITDDASAAQKRKKKVGLRGGKQSTVLSGIQTALKKRLGE